MKKKLPLHSTLLFSLLSIAVVSTCQTSPFRVPGDIELGFNTTGTYRIGKTFSNLGSASNVPSNLLVGIWNGDIYTSFAGIAVYSYRNAENSANNYVTSFAHHQGGVVAGEAMRIAPNGHVGIGTSDPGNYQLAVNGSEIFTKVQVKAGTPGMSWPDYVFHPGYELRSLSSLESYINKNKHLPGVPSTKEVEKDGLDLGIIQATLLKKIEELTLYVIALKKENEMQEKEINQLQKDKHED